jgi:hypothetical protein
MRLRVGSWWAHAHGQLYEAALTIGCLVHSREFHPLPRLTIGLGGDPSPGALLVFAMGAWVPIPYAADVIPGLAVEAIFDGAMGKAIPFGPMDMPSETVCTVPP